MSDKNRAWARLWVGPWIDYWHNHDPPEYFTLYEDDFTRLVKNLHHPHPDGQLFLEELLKCPQLNFLNAALPEKGKQLKVTEVKKALGGMPKAEVERAAAWVVKHNVKLRGLEKAHPFCWGNSSILCHLRQLLFMNFEFKGPARVLVGILLGQENTTVSGAQIKPWRAILALHRAWMNKRKTL
ncbi:MAG: hypothetical protein A3I39_01775 [Candidatus Yanofskybacteria bacterium RIFCSPLOWO2_02_FULL_47_9b]|uniref:Uncharacterized protein n=1 Tax=Candidatus Yanofskybacteria bacterium RIFCSPLOWO2_02_FULL_47_9b TaxID=1802708 RepID=A0A1F8H747_9BACT|nr:MAG: hypothetical protein A3I39_01775 [Candidatus Yanofskybacteria bacterium RIFCSPLOWO2_02_FULL_47_9b]